MQVVELKRRVVCRASRAEMWARISDTERLNRFVGNDPLDVRRVEDHASAARFVSTTRLGPGRVRYLEEPYEWSEGHFWRVRRELEGGPARSVEMRFDLRDEGEGCVVDVTMRLAPRLGVLRPLVQFFAGKGLDRVADYIALADARAREHRPVETPASPVDLAAAARAGDALRAKYPAALVARLVEHVTRADDVDARRIRPFELADAWGEDRMAVLKLCLAAVGAGLCELCWSILCPSCRGAADTIPSLDRVTGEAHCHACDLRYEVDLDRVVEAVFSPHPRVRRVDERPFCIGGPALVPHVIAQAVVAPGREATLVVHAEPGRYRLFGRGGVAAMVDVAEGAAASARVTLGDAAITPSVVDVAPGGSIIVTGDAAAEPRHVKLERTEWAQRAATAFVVSALPEFRAQFGGEALREGLALKVGSVAVLFSDLCGSTALYSRVGDAAAFGVVSDCLEYGRRAVERHGGTVVKTMGDAVMAAFIAPDRAVDAAAEMLAGWEAFQHDHPLARELDLKIGIFAGPCTIVTANSVLDYFGQTVNTAARLQGQAGARELVLHQSQVEVLAKIPEPLRVTERFEARVKGISTPLSLVRLGLEAAANV